MINERYDTLPPSRANLLLSNLVRFATRTTTLAALLALAISATASDRRPTAKINLHHWLQTGTASWYGHRFQGRRTATGETFDMNLLTCAHRSLPLGSWLRVTNLHNQKAIFVRVNDRGPYIGNRIIDLSYAAAHAVGIGSLGQVRLEAVGADDAELAKALVAQLQLPHITAQ